MRGSRFDFEDVSRGAPDAPELSLLESVRFPGNESFRGLSFYPEDETARMALEAAEQSGLLERCVGSLREKGLADSSISVLAGEDERLILRGVDAQGSHLDVCLEDPSLCRDYGPEI